MREKIDFFFFWNLRGYIGRLHSSLRCIVGLEVGTQNVLRKFCGIWSILSNVDLDNYFKGVLGIFILNLKHMLVTWTIS